jgi:hypothetical protein
MLQTIVIIIISFGGGGGGSFCFLEGLVGYKLKFPPITMFVIAGLNNISCNSLIAINADRWTVIITKPHY